jgi:NAD(P)-dependent dehydrogenase (short-subunit alcohol dehydrogenase family)
MSVKQLFDLTGRVALVTGGSRGLGLQIGEALGEMGARLVITARKKDELDAAVEHLASRNIAATALVCDLSNPGAVDPMVEESLRLGGKIDILVNNVGATWGVPTAEHPLEAWNKVVALNLTAAFLVSQAVGKRSMLPAKYGKIVNVASIAGLKGPSPDAIATIGYNTTKGGMINFTRALGSEWAPHGITVNAIAPGVFPSKMTKGMIEKYGDRISDRVPMKRIGGPEDLKGLAVLFASDASAFITGKTVAVDGGYTIV